MLQFFTAKTKSDNPLIGSHAKKLGVRVGDQTLLPIAKDNSLACESDFIFCHVQILNLFIWLMYLFKYLQV